MKRIIIKGTKSVEVVYAESLNRLITADYFNSLVEFPSTLFISTQSFYECYYDKLGSLFSDVTQFNWYICPDHGALNHIKMYNDVLAFIEEMELPRHTIVVGIGDYPMYHLCGFLQETSSYIGAFYFIPTTLTGFIHCLSGEAFLLNHQLKVAVHQTAIPERIIYDTMLHELESSDTWEQDFLSLVKIGLTSDRELLFKLYESNNRQHFSFSSYVEEVMSILLQQDHLSYLFGLTFSNSFYRLAESHYLTQQQKKYIGMLLHTYWSVVRNNLAFDMVTFTNWFQTFLNVDLRLPKQMVTYDLAEAIEMEMARSKKIACLNSIGSIEYVTTPSLDELYKVIDTYRNM
ncbi:MAG: hypothetical protein ACTJHC_09900 [Vagococcus sp.]